MPYAVGRGGFMGGGSLCLAGAAAGWLCLLFAPSKSPWCTCHHSRHTHRNTQSHSQTTAGIGVFEALRQLASHEVAPRDDSMWRPTVMSKWRAAHGAAGRGGGAGGGAAAGAAGRSGAGAAASGLELTVDKGAAAAILQAD